MKTIQLTPRQRKDIEERRRHAQDRRIYQRLSAVLWIDEGRTREEVAQLVGVSTRQVGQWLRIFRNKGLKELCTLYYKGDPGRLRPAQIEQLKHQIAQGGFHNAEQVRTWIENTFGVVYSATGVKGLLRRIGASYHKVSGFFWKADVKKQKQFVPARTASVPSSIGFFLLYALRVVCALPEASCGVSSLVSWEMDGLSPSASALIAWTKTPR